MSEQLPPVPEPVQSHANSRSIAVPAPAPNRVTAKVWRLLPSSLESFLCALRLVGSVVAPSVSLGSSWASSGRKSAGKGLATAGIILSVVGLLLTIVFVILGVVLRGPILNTIYNQIYNQIGTGQ